LILVSCTHSKSASPIRR